MRRIRSSSRGLGSGVQLVPSSTQTVRDLRSRGNILTGWRSHRTSTGSSPSNASLETSIIAPPGTRPAASRPATRSTTTVGWVIRYRPKGTTALLVFDRRKPGRNPGFLKFFKPVRPNITPSRADGQLPNGRGGTCRLVTLTCVKSCNIRAEEASFPHTLAPNLTGGSNEEFNRYSFARLVLLRGECSCPGSQGAQHDWMFGEGQRR